MSLFIRYLLCLSLGLIACSSKKTAEPPRSTLVTAQKDSGPPPSWLAGFKKGPVGLPAVLKGVSFASSPDELKALDPLLLTDKPMSLGQDTNATIRIVRHADSRTLRSVRLDFPDKVKRTLSSRWGDPVEGQVDGQRPAFFWFDRKARLQGILEEKEKTSQLSFWPYSSLNEALSPPDVAQERTLANWLGKTASAHDPLSATDEAPFKTRLSRGPPLQYRTRPSRSATT